tara:strand:+ start:1066 stop:2004 length:939 start_codon:yes stop_codon:yes gene_type:complete
MSKLSKKDFFVYGDDRSPEEVKSIDKRYNDHKDEYERLGSSKRDNVLCATDGLFLLDEFGENSHEYKTWLESMKVKSAGWANHDYRKAVLNAGRGFNSLTGVESEKEWIWKQNPSMSALGAVRDIPPQMMYNLTSTLKGRTKFPTKELVDNYREKEKFLLSAEEKKANEQARAEERKEREVADAYLASQRAEFAKNKAETASTQTIDVVSMATKVSSNEPKSSPTPSPVSAVEEESPLEIDEPVSLLNQDEPGEQAETEPKTPTPSDSYQLYKAIESYVQTNYRTWSEEDEHNMRMSVELIARYSRGRIRPH